MGEDRSRNPPQERQSPGSNVALPLLLEFLPQLPSTRNEEILRLDTFSSFIFRKAWVTGALLKIISTPLRMTS